MGVRALSSRAAASLFIASVCTVALFGTGCSAFRVPEEPPAPTPMTPVWSDDELDDHLDFLNRTDAAARTTGTQEYARAAAYVAARMREFRLQPAVGEDYRMLYTTPMNYPMAAALRTVAGEDSSAYYPGIDFLPHGRSDSGRVAVDLMVVTRDTAGVASAPRRPFGVLFADGDVDISVMRAWRDAGAVLAITVESLLPRYSTERVRRLVAVQVSPTAASRLIPIYLSVTEPGRAFEMRRQIVAYVHAAFQPDAGAVNIMGTIAGKHPQRARDAILVCTDMDAIGGSFGGVEAVDYRNFGIGTAAMLEVARNLGYVSRRWHVPDRTILMAIWSGSQLEHQGLREFLTNPTWSLSRIVSVIYVGLRPDEEPAVRRLLAERGLDLHVIPPSDTPLHDRPLVLLPQSTDRRQARERRRFEDPAERDRYDLPDISDVVKLGIEQARAMAAATYDRVVVEATDARPFMPVDEDKLTIPSAAGLE